MEKELIPFIDNLETLVSEFNELYQARLVKKQDLKKTERKRTNSNSINRELIFKKTEGLCHVCGCELDINDFEADHIKPHSQGGTEVVGNFLPSCSKCNNYRWNYSPEEIQWILKLGVWFKTKIQERNTIGLETASEFILDEIKREKRRKSPRKPKTGIRQSLFPIKGKHKHGYIESTAQEIEKATNIIAKFELVNNSFLSETEFINKSFLITGESTMKRKDLESLLLEKQGVIKKTLSKNLDYLVIGNFYGLMKVYELEKLNDVKNANIKIITQNELIEFLNNKNHNI